MTKVFLFFEISIIFFDDKKNITMNFFFIRDVKKNLYAA